MSCPGTGFAVTKEGFRCPLTVRLMMPWRRMEHAIVAGGRDRSRRRNFRAAVYCRTLTKCSEVRISMRLYQQ